MVFYKMHKCIICNNNSSNVGNSAIPVTFHSIPKNQHRRQRWLQCLKIKSCYDWYRVCSDHFSKEDYKPGGKRWLYHAAVPKLKPYEAVDMPFTEKDLSCIDNEHETEQALESFENENLIVNDNEESRRYTTPTNTDNTPYSPSTSTQKHDSEYDAEQTLESSEIRIDNPSIIAIGPPRRSSRKSKPVTTEDFIMYPNKSSIQNNNLQKGANTDDELHCNDENTPIPEFFSLKPKISVGSGMRCSVQNCPNTQSNTTGVSFHGYPIANNNLLQIWIQNCGIQNLVKPNEKFKTNLKVCGYHFEDGMYMTSLKKRLKSDAIPTLFYNNDENDGAQSIYSVNENNHMIEYISASNSGIESRREREPRSTTIMLNQDFNNKQNSQDVASDSFDNLKCCCIPNCDSKTVISSDGSHCTTLYTPSSREVANEWSYILNLPLSVRSVLCEKHFNPEDVETESQNLKNKLLTPNNAMPAMSKNKRALKRQIVNDVNNDSLNKKVKNNLTDDIQTTACAEDEFIDMNSSNVIRTDGSDTHPHLKQYLPKIFTNGSLSISLQPSTKQNMHVSESEMESANNSAANLDTVLKTTINDHDNSSQSSFEQMPSTNTSLSFTLNPGVMQNKPTDISRSTSVINAEPAENIKTISTNSSSYSRVEELLSIPKTLRNNNSVSISFKPNLPSTSATTPQSSFKQTEHDSASTSQLTNNQIASLKTEPNIEYRNLNFINNMPQVNSDSDDLIFNDVQCVHDFSKNIELPNYFWKTVCLKNPNKTIFTQRDYFMKIIKKVFFYNNLVPIIVINNKRYEYNATIETKNKLEILLEKIDNIEVCLGYDGYIHEQCIGYFEDSSKETCVKCQELTKDEYLHSMNAILKIKSNRIVQLENQIAEKEVRVNQKRLIYINERKIKENMYVRTTIKPPFGLIGSI